MDYTHIAAASSPEIARRLQNDDYYNNRIAGRETEIDGQQLDDLTRGAEILGVEPIEWPLTDGIELYMKTPAGSVISLLVESEADSDGNRELLHFGKTEIGELNHE